MHGLMNRAIQGFLRDTYGEDLWARILGSVRLHPDGFEAMLHYDDAVTETVLSAAADQLGRARDTILEDIGTWLVSSRTGQPLRRLLRFGGVSFTDFLHSLEDLPGRGRLALPDLGLPALTLHEPQPGVYDLTCQGLPGFSHVLIGVLRAMADDYGALVLLDHCGGDHDGETLRIQLLAADFTEGRRFDLAGEG
ncbi:Haem-NO-binding [Gemmobacter megaterium]|uniref:Haem-NO-binding n=1 Tax=Gemmobacter megaterium TaxID=1086013 RepID=A0A1N7P9Z0_9RHOB|nr:heme NO-binding domain-containing protein [Gemmobacter megaterium]GGE19476.1 hypothetical protein GCM10011345_26700 [Gemmobacter megaterium]SIT07455.1 Haem-NO-binding [Gemmobacter megaterium]